MHQIKLILLIALLFSINVFADEYSDFKGTYQIYSKNLENTDAPTKDDKKLALTFDEKISKTLFEAMKPDVKNSCLDKKDRYRKKGDLECIRYQSGEHVCYLGFDLIKGKTILGSYC